MTPAIPTPTTGSEFDEFLYAQIGEEHNGMLLSVLSALARLNVDPWDEAARLAHLPRDAARCFLTALIAALPDGPSARTDPAAVAERLIALLPQRGASNRDTPNPAHLEAITVDRPDLTRYMFLGIILAMLALGAQWLLERSQDTTRPDSVSSPTDSSVLSHISAPLLSPAAPSSQH